MKELQKTYLLNYNGYGNGNGNGDGDGNGNGDGDGNGDGYGNGDGNSYGDSYGDGDGYGDSYGDGDGNGYGYGDGYGDSDGYGNGLYMAKLWGEWFEIAGELENSLCHNLPHLLYNKIDKEFLQRVTNLESLRSLREKIGLERYISLFDAKVVNEETDRQGNQMKLYKYDEKGSIVILLEVVCPSTKRMYHLYPANQKSKTCFEAKASTFGMTIDEFKPFSES
jgi:hypothetical protein